MKILIVEDDLMIAELLSEYLSTYAEVEHIVYPFEALKRLDEVAFDVIILDLTLPQIDGLKVCQMMRAISQAKIIISSARCDIDDKLFALENGADDYLPKPYDPRELYARIRLLHQRSQSTKEPSNSLFHIDSNACTISKANTLLDLTLAEYEIMQLFIQNEGQAFSRTDIANTISAHRFDSGLESINVLVGRLRKKVEENHKTPQHIITVRGIGYRFSA